LNISYQWTCLECGTNYEGRFSDSCPKCNGGKTIIDNTGYKEADPEPLPETLREISERPSIEPVENVEVGGAPTTPEGVSKMPKPNHTRKGRPRLTTLQQLSLTDQQGLSLRKRAVLLGTSAATVLRRDRGKIAANIVAGEN
jgi:hypothetical protein